VHPGFPKFKSLLILLLILLLLAAASAARVGLLLVCYRKGCLEKLDAKPACRTSRRAPIWPGTRRSIGPGNDAQARPSPYFNFSRNLT
jgi:hypothetical protein